MAPPNHHRSRGEIEVEMNGNRNGTNLNDFIPVYLSPAANGQAGPTIDSIASVSRHDHDHKPSTLKKFVNWIQSPMNLVLFLWLIPIIIGLLLMLLLITGALNGAIKSSDRRKQWTEVVNQILNALFTIGCFYTHPEVFYHLLFIVRWKPADQERVRDIYCKNKTPEPRDRFHLLFVVCLINLTWVGQYIMCGLYWAYNRHNRPSGVLNFWVVVTLAAPIFASIYTVKGPLKSKKTEEEIRADQVAESARDQECKLRLCSGGVVVASPEWKGGLCDCCNNYSVGFSSLFCLFCVFGRNMHRLGFGSKNMHIVTFIIAVVSPFVVFYITALKIDNDSLKVILITTGGLLSWVGFLYGGYWRIKMRERFNLPENPFCLGYPFLTDYFQWLFCGPCSLAQEVRTANFYDIEEGRHELASLSREANSLHLESSGSFSWNNKDVHAESVEPGSFGRLSTHTKVHAMAPPHPPSM